MKFGSIGHGDVSFEKIQEFGGCSLHVMSHEAPYTTTSNWVGACASEYIENSIPIHSEGDLEKWLQETEAAPYKFVGFNTQEGVSWEIWREDD